MYILDTNTLIYFFKNRGNVKDNLLSKSPQEIGIPSIVLFELEVGIQKSRNPEKRTRQLEQMLSTINILSFSHKEAKISAKLRSDLEKRGNIIGPWDILIAGTAISNQGVLVTHNIKEFQRIKDLKIEDWY